MDITNPTPLPPKMILSIIQPKENFCIVCKKTFSTIGNLRNHVMTIHENKRPFKCTFPGCTKSYSIQSRLQVHYRIHVSKYNYNVYNTIIDRYKAV